MSHVEFFVKIPLYSFSHRDDTVAWGEMLVPHGSRILLPWGGKSPLTVFIPYVRYRFLHYGKEQTHVRYSWHLRNVWPWTRLHYRSMIDLLDLNKETCNNYNRHNIRKLLSENPPFFLSIAWKKIICDFSPLDKYVLWGKISQGNIFSMGKYFTREMRSFTCDVFHMGK